MDLHEPCKTLEGLWTNIMVVIEHYNNLYCTVAIYKIRNPLTDLLTDHEISEATEEIAMKLGTQLSLKSQSLTKKRV